MENKLKELRKSMDKAGFNQLTFSDHLRNHVLKKINNQNENEEDLYLAVLQLLINKKTGYDLVQLFHARGILNFEGNEGYLYTLLHNLEKNSYLISRWNDDGEKLYHISDRGRKVLLKTERKYREKGFLLRSLLEE